VASEDYSCSVRIARTMCQHVNVYSMLLYITLHYYPSIYITRYYSILHARTHTYTHRWIGCSK
jgi:hypothetical protein